MKPTRLLLRHSHQVSQVLAFMLKDIPFSAAAAAAAPFSGETLTEVLRAIPTFFFLPAPSIARHSPASARHRTPLKQRNLRSEYNKLRSGSLVLGPAAHRDPTRIRLGLSKSMELFFWVESLLGFTHNECTVKEMAIVIAKSNELRVLWEFLKEMSRRENTGLVSTTTVTCLIKVLSEEGLVNEALCLFYRMRKFHCKPDVVAYNTMIYGLCKVGFFRKAKLLLEQMELPGFRCPPDKYTYTILISSYCRYALQTGCRKAIRRRLWEANRLFRLMLFKGFEPDVVTYNCLIDGCCKSYRIERALELFEDMKKRGYVPNRVTYNSFIRYYSVVNEIEKAIQMLSRMREMGHGVPSLSSYTPIIHAFCETGRAVEAMESLVELVNGGSIPREYTFKLVCDALRSAGQANLMDDEMYRRIEDGIVSRYMQVKKMKPIMNRKNAVFVIEDE